MPFKVRCRFVRFMGDEENFPCQFGYKEGDEFTYDGEKFTGRICSGLLATMVPVVLGLHRFGNAGPERMSFRYHGLSARDPSMKKYDGIGLRPLKEPPEGMDARALAIRAKPATEPAKGWYFVCGDSRTTAFFMAEPYDLADAGAVLPEYRRQMAILEKVKAEPGLTPEELLSRFTEWERDEIYPQLTLILTKLFMDEMAETGYIEYREGRAFPGEKAAAGSVRTRASRRRR
jgi:uncharacterized repeat protein (TIGR04076 family)